MKNSINQNAAPASSGNSIHPGEALQLRREGLPAHGRKSILKACR